VHPELEASMNVRPTILCAIDFSEPSTGALRYAAAVAAHFATRLIVLTVEDPLVTEAVDLGTGTVWSPEDCRQEMEEFAGRIFGSESSMLSMMEYEVAVGRPSAEILRVARERSCELIVMSTHGLTGMRKLFFGSTTERVLRETTKPVLVTPPHDGGIARASKPIAARLPMTAWKSCWRRFRGGSIPKRSWPTAIRQRSWRRSCGIGRPAWS
jgi:nucleotide-binding universal stress UspA family protein